MLHSSPDSREVLLGYLKDLRAGSAGTSLSERLEEDHPQVAERFTNYIASLQGVRHAD